MEYFVFQINYSISFLGDFISLNAHLRNVYNEKPFNTHYRKLSMKFSFPIPLGFNAFIAKNF